MGLVKLLKSKLRRKSTGAVAGDDDANKNNSNCRQGMLKVSWNEIETITRHFSVTVGYGGFSNVYLAELHGGSSMAAVKILQRCSQRLLQAYRNELEILLCLRRHDHIVKLLGYSDDGEEGALIFEYVSNGTLQDKLHGSDKVLPWRTRMSIAYQLAQAMAHLHDTCIVHGDIKPSNLLLDDNLNCKLCDFGSAKMGFSSSVVPNSNRAMLVGSPGYTDPLYMKTGLPSKKNDIYSFGVIVLELITGLEATKILKNADYMARMVDPRIRGEVVMEEFRVMVELSGKCLCECPNIRPSARDIVDTLKDRIANYLTYYSCTKVKGHQERV